MSITVCLGTSTIRYPQGGGHLWVFLNWALGLRASGCQVIWLETIRPNNSKNKERLAALKTHLEPYGFAESVALCSRSNEPLPHDFTEECLDLNAAAEADLLLNLYYGLPSKVVERFRRSALVDIDPGLLQLWVSSGEMFLPRHDLYFTIGETVGQSESRFPDCGLQWLYTPPCVALDWWPTCQASESAPFTTVSHWNAGQGMKDGDEAYSNDKRTGFLPFLDLPRWTTQPLELALCLGADEAGELLMLQKQSWKVRHSWEVTSTPQDYQHYIQESRGEFSCVKPSYVRLQTAWISDRTLCYLASGKPAVVEHTGPSRFLPDAEGLFRFRNLEEAATALAIANSDYEWHCQQARALAEEHFDAQKICRRVLDQALA